MKIPLCLVLLFLPALLSGCVKMYTLPDAPPEAEWERSDAFRESPEEATRRFLEAKRAAIQCFSALSSKKWDKAMSWMSQKTLEFFELHSQGKGRLSVFENGTIWIDNEELAFDPVSDVFIRDLTDIRDEFGDRKDNENESRRVLYAVSKSGKARELVFVLEEDKWRLDMSALQNVLLTE